MEYTSVWTFVKGVLLGCVLCLKIHLAVTSRLDRPSSLIVDAQPVVSDQAIPACHNFTNGDWNKMEFYSPGYPGQYPNNIDCVMYLQAPPGFNIELSFMERFSVEESTKCLYDYIEFRDGPFGYSDLIARFCGDGFPVTIQTTSRFLWTRFKTDDLLPYDGFKAEYKYTMDETYSPVTQSREVCRIYMDNMGADGELTSEVFPLGDTTRDDYPSDKPVDCTWEMHVSAGYRVRISLDALRMPKRNLCERNKLEVYDSTTSETNRSAVTCDGLFEDYVSESNTVYLRVFGSRLTEKPILSGIYTVFRPGPCGSREFACDGMCLSPALKCNGHRNCPSGLDERGCGSAAASSGGGSEPIPLMVIILAAVGGLIFTAVVIGTCVTCRYKRQEKNKQLQKQDSQKKNALELAVLNSDNTNFALAKQNSQNYYSLPRPSAQATMMQRGSSFSSKPPSEGEYGDHVSETSTYKKFLQLEQSLDEDSSRCPSPYSPGPVFTTIVEHHNTPQGMTPDLGWGYQGYAPPDQPNSPTLAENLSKLQQYTSSIPKGFPQQHGGNDSGGMTMDFRYDPSTPVYPATKFRIKSDNTYGWQGDSKFGKSLMFKNVDADVAPDLTKEIESR